MAPSNPECKSTMLIWDNGVSFGLNSFKSDFIDYVESVIPVQNFTKVNWFIDIGTLIHKFDGTNGTTCYLPCVPYYVPYTDV